MRLFSRLQMLGWDKPHVWELEVRYSWNQFNFLYGYLRSVFWGFFHLYASWDSNRDFNLAEESNFLAMLWFLAIFISTLVDRKKLHSWPCYLSRNKFDNSGTVRSDQSTFSLLAKNILDLNFTVRDCKIRFLYRFEFK